MATQPAPQPETQAPAQAAPGPAKTQDEEAVSRITIAAAKMIYDKGILQNLLQILKSGDPAEGLAQATLFVMKGLFEASKGTLPPKAFLPAVQQVMPLIAELGEAAGILKADEATVKQAAMIFAQKIKAEAGKRGAGTAAAPTPATDRQPAVAAQPGIIAQTMEA